ncbi:MAG: GNAT family N-acetyltransferase [Eubacteriales bacterium]|nr:GNAT family N-acetyltransferase [Eubacteriales bacterium]
MPYLYGKRILLRDYRQDDYNAIRAWVNDRETVQYLSSRYWMPQSATDTADMLEHATHAGPNGAFFVIADLESEEYLGQIDLISINWKLRLAEMAIVLGRETQRGRGFGGEAIALLLEYAFTTLGLMRVELDVAVSNRRAIRCYQKAGFLLEGTKRKAFMVGGEYEDLAMMAVLKEDWQKAHRTEKAQTQ